MYIINLFQDKDMNLINLMDELHQFKERIVQVLHLKQCDSQFNLQINLQTLIRQGFKYLNQCEKSKNKKKNTPQLQAIRQDLTSIYREYKNGFMPQKFQFLSSQDKNLEELKKCVDLLRGKKLTKYYGYVRGPFLNGCYIQHKSQLDRAIENFQVNNLKFITIDESSVYKYQRNLIQEIYGRIFREQGSLSIVARIQLCSDLDESNPTYRFCFIEDIKILQHAKHQNLSNLQKFNYQLKENEKIAFEKSVLEALLADILVIPIQTLVSDFILDAKKGSILKCNNSTHEQIISQKNLKDHPSLRNPLFYFRKYLKSKKITKDVLLQLQKGWDMLYCSFYRSLQIVIELMAEDFDVKIDKSIQNSSSICFSHHVFKALSSIFHEIYLLSAWVKQIIHPIKDTVTLSQIIDHFCPIFNQIYQVQQSQSFEEYKKRLIDLEMQTYFHQINNRIPIQRYKDLYISNISLISYKKMSSSKQIFQNIIFPVISQIDLLYCDPVEAAFILHLEAKYYWQYCPQSKQLAEQIWLRVFNCLKNKNVHFIDFGLDILAYKNGFNSYEYDLNCFDRVKWVEESEKVMEGVRKLVDIVNQNFEQQSQNILSNLLQKSFEHSKFKICQCLIEKKVRIRDFIEIIKSYAKKQNKQSKQSIIDAIQQKSQQMQRLYKWQQIFVSKLSQQEGLSKPTPIKSFQAPNFFFIQEKFLKKNIDQEKVINNLSRRDCRFKISKEIALIQDKQKDYQFYLQRKPYPLIQYFYKIFLTELNASSLMFNFCSFKHNNEIYQITQCLPIIVNMKKLLQNYSQAEILLMTDIQKFGQAIILSMVLLPSEVKLEDIYFSPKTRESGQILIIDWSSAYQKNFMYRYKEKICFGSKNSLFLTQFMQKSIHPKLISKYSKIDVNKICEHVLKECIGFIQVFQQFNQVQYEDEFQSRKQLLAIIFQQGFMFQCAQRMFKIKRALSQGRKINSYFQLLEILHPQTSYYYQQVLATSINLQQRQAALFDYNWKRSYLHTNMESFFGSFSKVDEVQVLFPVDYLQQRFHGSSESLAHYIKNRNKFDAFNSKIEWKIFSYNNQSFQYILKHIDLSTEDESNKNKFLNQLKKKSNQHLNSQRRILPLNFISFKNQKELKKMYLDNFSFDRIEQVLIQCCNFGSLDMDLLPSSLGNVKYLHLKNIFGLKYIGEKNIQGNYFQIKNLKSLSISNCKQLISINIDCSILQSVNLRSNQNLQNLFIHSKHLKNIYNYNNRKIKVTNLGIYILKGVNVLVCRSVVKAYDISKIYSSNYEKQIEKTVKQLLQSLMKLDQRYIIGLTLYKTKQIDEVMFSQISKGDSWIYKKISNKYSLTQLQHIATEILKLYFANGFIKSIKLGSNIMGIKNIFGQGNIMKAVNQGLKKIEEKKTLRSIRIGDSNKIFSGIQIEDVEKFADLIKVQKQFTLCFESLQENDQIHLENERKFIKKIMDKSVVQAMTLQFENSFIKLDFLYSVLSKNQSGNKCKITKLRVKQCRIQDEPQNIHNFPLKFQSIKLLFLKNCTLSFKLLSYLPYLEQIYLQGCNESFDMKKDFLLYLSSIENLKCLSLDNFFEWKPESYTLFKMFCETLKKLSKLKILILNKNYLLISYLKMFDQVLNQTNISELKLENMFLLQMYNQSLISSALTNEKEQPIPYLRNFLTGSKKLKKLTIQLKNIKYIEQFVHSLSKNSSITNFIINSRSQLPSNILDPLFKNKNIVFIHSNKQLPMLLLNHIKRNQKQFQGSGFIPIEDSSQQFCLQNLTYDDNNSRTSFNILQPIKIGLSLDGGGMRGMILASELEYLAEKVGYPLHKIFDCIGGTSIGGILGLSIGSTLDGINPIIPNNRLSQLFTKYGTQIFNKRFLTGLKNIGAPKYNPTSIEQLLKNYFKDSKLSNCLKQTSMIVPAINRLQNNDYIFRSKQALLDRQRDFFIRDVARATSAAPTYFPSAQIQNANGTINLSLIDGGLGLNNPSKLVIDEVKKISSNSGCPQKYFLLSLATGKVKCHVVPKNAGLKDVGSIVDSYAVSSNQFLLRDLQSNYKGHYYRVQPILNFEDPNQAELDNTSHQIIEKYKQIGRQAAIENFKNTITFGKYRNQSLIQWLKQNTQKKYQLIEKKVLQ